MSSGLFGARKCAKKVSKLDNLLLEAYAGTGRDDPKRVQAKLIFHDFELSDHIGRNVVLYFHPLAWTSVCAMQMKSLEDNKNAWAESLGIKQTSLLSDFWPHGGVAQAYGLFRDKEGSSERANIIVDEHQNVAFINVYEIKQLPNIDEVLDALRKMQPL